ncbi:MAG: carbon-phosphorus lyase complex subunit PhnI [Desulfovibrio sp.]|uniref:carbon-phosphorus lyase complex subunit PhnI n=1 Tax=Desulfovibrio sp. TaxID=885 RepID=UPI002A371C1D|nr:carbon-phosphorus lyase complex subunit PhnI [Desulfovibrio sp.]MDY0259451.1 carbon-phosphorus lyase complex subunit PhnI [Desulfovibrio sp.]
MYVAVKGGEKAINAAHKLLARARRGDTAVPELGVDQIMEQLSLSVDRVMAEGALYAPELAALAVKQARGDLVEAVFLLRAFRTTLSRFGSSLPVNTAAMRIRRRISATYKDIPGGQVLGHTFDYTHRLLDASLLTRAARDFCGSLAEQATQESLQATAAPAQTLPESPQPESPRSYAKVMDFLEKEGLLPTPAEEDANAPSAAPTDITRGALTLPAGRDARLQNLARGDEGLMLALAYSTQRGYGSTHPFAGEIRMGSVEVSFVPEELGFAVVVARLPLTECETVNKFHGGNGVKPCFTRGYGLSFGENERKALSMALVDRALQSADYDEPIKGPAQDEEFVLSHSDNVEASGFVQHLKLPHYVDFQAELALVRGMRRAMEDTDAAANSAGEGERQ